MMSLMLALLASFGVVASAFSTQQAAAFARASGFQPAGPRSSGKTDVAQLRITLEKPGRSLSFDCQKQLWLYRRCPATYTLDGEVVEIRAEGSRAKLEAFRAWIEKATSGEPQGTSAESGGGGGLASVEWLEASGTLAGWTSVGVDSSALVAAEGPGFLGAPGAAADEATNDVAVADMAAAQVTSLIDVEAAAAVAASKGVVGTVPQEIRESFVGKAFGAAALDVDAAASDDLDLSEEDLAAFARDLLGE